MTFEQVKQLKESIKAKMSGLVELCQRTQLPEQESSFNTAKSNLDKQDFDIVVCGEIKQGKSSFINALLGKELLPVADQVATSQVFRISNAPEESFYLVFTDGKRIKLENVDDLKKYGSETVAQQERDPLLIGRQLQWIEVNTPAAFLPPGIHLLDTPGLGALYYSHAEITHRYVDMADAVIFLKCANEPLVDKEISFLKKVFGITPHVLFIQSKSDMYDESVRQQQTARNQEILNQELAQFVEGRKFNFWPLSSANLFQAAQEQDAEMRNFLRKSSGFDALSDALSDLIFQTSGYSIVSSAIEESLRFKERMRSAIENECKLLEATSGEEKQRIQNEMKQKQNAFNAAWGQNGKEYRSLVESISRVISSGEALAKEIFSSRGEIAIHFLRQIDDLPLDNGVIEAFAAELDEELPAAVSNKWRELIFETQNELCVLFGGFRVGLDMNVDSGEIATLVADARSALTKSKKFSTLKNVANGATVGSTLGLIGGIALASVTAGASLLIGPTIGGIWGATAAKKEISTRQAEQNKSRLQRYIATYLQQVSSQYLLPQGVGKNSRIGEIFGSLKKATETAVGEIIKKEKATLEAEYERLREDAQCNVEETKKLLVEKKEFLAQLIRIGEDIQSLKANLNN
ncbi:MAG: dynamin family protein [Planctomycetia bacterium]|nr:dynamin family protein [Planctomycetia bacterium]